MLEQFITVMSQNTNRKRVLDKVLPYILEISRAELGAFFVVDAVSMDEINRLILVAQHNMPRKVIDQLIDGSLKKQLQTQSNGNSNLRVLQVSIMQSLLYEYNLKYLIGLPLQCGGKTLGGIVIGTYQNSNLSFNKTTLHQLSTIAQLTALFLERIHLQTENQRKAKLSTKSPVPPSDLEVEVQISDQSIEDLEKLLEAVMSAEEEVIQQNEDLGILNTLSGEIGGTLHPSKILQSAVEQTMSAVGAESGCVYLVDGDSLTLLEAKGFSKGYVNAMRRLTPGSGAEGMAFSRNEPIFRDSVLFHSGRNREVVREEGLRTVAAVPLVAGSSPFGVLSVATRQTRIWSMRDERMLISIGQRVAQAILNAQMFTNLQSKANNLENRNMKLQHNAFQLYEDFKVLKQQIGEILKHQQRIWLTIPNANDTGQVTVQQREMIQSSEHVITVIRRALDVISKT